MRFLHKLPKAKLIKSRDEWILNFCRGKVVLHLGFADEGLMDERLAVGDWLHEKLVHVAQAVVGIDISERGVKKARDLGFSYCFVGDVEKLNSIIETLPFDKSHFEVVLAADIIEHLNNPGAFLKELYEFVDSNTDIIITTPNALSFKTLFFPIAKVEIVHPDHNFWYSPITLIDFLAKFKFEVVEIYLYSSVWIPKKENIRSVGELLGKYSFSIADFLFTNSVLRLFPYYAEGMLLKVKKKP